LQNSKNNLPKLPTGAAGSEAIEKIWSFLRVTLTCLKFLGVFRSLNIKISREFSRI
jgi:hypothetical protein